MFVIVFPVEGISLGGNLIDRLTKHVNILSDVVSFKLRLFQENIERKYKRK